MGGGGVAKVLTKTGAMVRAWARVVLYKVVLFMVLIYGIQSWVVMVAVLKVMEGFHHQVARRILGKTSQRNVDGEYKWPPVADAV